MAEPPRKLPGNPYEQFAARDEAEARADQRALEDVLYQEKVEFYKALRSAVRVEQASREEDPVKITESSPSSRSALVAEFIRHCNAVSSTRIYKRQIWQAVGHTKGRQFEYWQACSPKATAADHRNFTRILDMAPSAFVDLLKQKQIVT